MENNLVPIGTLTQDAESAVQWKIEGFSSLEMYELYFSPEFSCAGGDWCLYIHRVYPEGGRRGQRIELQLYRYTGPRILDVEYTFSVKHRDGHRHGEQRNRKTFGRFTFYQDIPIELEEERMSDLVPGDTLMVHCQLECIDPTQGAGENSRYGSTLSHSRNKKANLPHRVQPLKRRKITASSEECTSGCSPLSNKNNVLRDLKQLFLDQEDSDVIIRVKGREFKAHRLILKARSPVFASAFRSDMKERATGVIEIEDCDPSSFSIFLRYLYCGAMEDLSAENVFSLFTTADKYDVQDLRSECLEFVKENLSVDTFCDTFTLALRHSETELTDLATDFFTKNAPQIILTAKWQQFLIDNPTQSNELFIKFTTFIGQSKK